MRILVLAALLLLPLFPAKALGSDTLSHVGIHVFSVGYSPTKSEMKGILWYPTSAATHRKALGPYTVEVAEDAAITAGKHPLVVISHGNQGSHLGHRDTALYLAERGYMVISLLHPKNNFMDNSAGETRSNWVNRPRHVSAVLDWILKDAAYKDAIDDTKIGVIGHSAGGYTALALVGGMADMAGLDAYCDKQSDDPVFCGEAKNTRTRLSRMSPNDQAVNADPLGTFRDSRIKAAVLMAPVGILFRDAKSLSMVTAPVLIFRAEKDEILRFPYHAESIRRKLPVQPRYIKVKNAGHYSFLSPFPEERKKIVGAPAHDPEGFDRAEFHKEMNKEICAFLNASLGH